MLKDGTRTLDVTTRQGGLREVEKNTMLAALVKVVQLAIFCSRSTRALGPVPLLG
jgi:hypothetical protein